MDLNSLKEYVNPENFSDEDYYPDAPQKEDYENAEDFKLGIEEYRFNLIYELHNSLVDEINEAREELWKKEEELEIIAEYVKSEEDNASEEYKMFLIWKEKFLIQSRINTKKRSDAAKRGATTRKKNRSKSETS